MTHVSDKRLGEATRYFLDVIKRIEGGTLNFDDVKAVLNPVVHGRSRGLGLFTSPQRQLELAREWTGTYPLDDMLFERARGTIPSREGLGPLEAIVLDIQLESAFDTFRFALNRIRKHCFSVPSLGMEDLEILSKIEVKPRSLEWRVIDLGAFSHGNETVQSVCDSVDPDRLPHSAVLWCLAFFPKWVQAIGTTVHGVYVPGVQIAGYRALGQALTIERDDTSRKINMHYLLPNEPYYGLAIPVLSALKYPAAS